MTDLQNRQRAFEAQFARDEEVGFRLIARRNRLFGLWAAGRMGLTAEEAGAYAISVVQADFEEVGDEDVLRKVGADLTAANVSLPHDDLRAQLEAMLAEAKRQFAEAPSSKASS